MQRDGEAYPAYLTASRLRLRRIKEQALKRRFGLDMWKARHFFFDAGHFERLMRRGSWSMARCYLQRFLWAASRPWSPPADGLLIHLTNAQAVATIVAGGPYGAMTASLLDGAHPSFAPYRDVLHQMHADLRRASKVWKKAVPFAVNLALDMAAKCPELKDKLQLLRNRRIPWAATSIFGVRGPKRMCCKAADLTPADCRKAADLTPAERLKLPYRGPKWMCHKAVDRTPADVLACAFLRQKRSLSVQETNTCSGVASAAPGPFPLFTKLEQIIQKTIIS